jgi:hypothetical protein
MIEITRILVYAKPFCFRLDNKDQVWIRNNRIGLRIPTICT